MAHRCPGKNGRSMKIEVSVNVDFVPFGSFRLQLSAPKAEPDDTEELKERLAWPYELPGHTGAVRGPVSIWGTSG